MLFVLLEKWASWSGLGLSFRLGLDLWLVKVVGFTAFKLLKLLVSLEKKRKLSVFTVAKLLALFISLNRTTLNLLVSVQKTNKKKSTTSSFEQ